MTYSEVSSLFFEKNLQQIKVTLIRNSVEIDKKGHTIVENMRQSGNRFVDRPG